MGNYPAEKMHQCGCTCCQNKNLLGYRYKCLECENDYDLCGECFEKRKTSQSHKTNHKMIRFIKLNKSHCGTTLDLPAEWLNLASLKEIYKHVIHLQIKCKICQCEPIKGLRFKCDTCKDFDLCVKCCKKSFETHLTTHSMICHFQTRSLNVDFNEIQLQKKTVDNDKGSFGKVHRALYERETVACKIIKARSSSVDRYEAYCLSYIREIEAYSQIKGENILRMIGHCKNVVPGGFDFVIITELMKCDLQALIQDEPFLTDSQRVSIATGIACGMKRIHEIGFIHRDIKPANILVTVNNVPKIADMGIARLVEGEKTYLLGPPAYMPPEFFARPPNFTNKLDVFSFGLTVNQLFGGKHVTRLVNENLNNEITEQCNPLIWNFIIVKCIDKDPSQRATAQEIEARCSFLNEQKNNYDEDSYSNYEKFVYGDLTTKIVRLKDYFYTKGVVEDGITKEYCYKIWNKMMCAFNSFNEWMESVYSEWKEEANSICKENDPILAYLNHNLETKSNQIDLDYIVTLLVTIEYYFNECEDSLSCISLSDKCLNVCGSLFENETCKNPYAASALYWKASSLFSLEGDTRNALKEFKVVFDMYKHLYGENSKESEKACFKIGECLFELDDINESLKFFLECLDVGRLVYGNNSMHVANVLGKISECYERIYDFDKFSNYWKQMLAIKRKLFENNEKVYQETILVKGRLENQRVWCYILIRDDTKFLNLKKRKLQRQTQACNGDCFSEFPYTLNDFRDREYRELMPRSNSIFYKSGLAFLLATPHEKKIIFRILRSLTCVPKMDSLSYYIQNCHYFGIILNIGFGEKKKSIETQ